MDDARGMPAVERLQALADPCAAARALRHDREPVERAASVLLLHGVGDVSETGMKQERLGLAEFVEHAVDETQEYAGVHAHRARRIQQHDQPQWLVLALPLHQADRHPPMADVAVDGAAEIEPVAAPPREVPSRQSRAHDLRELRCSLVGLGDLFGIGELAEIDLGEIFRARGAFHPSLAALPLGRIVGRRHLVGHRLAARFSLAILQALERRAVRRLPRRHRPRPRAHAPAEPERIEQPVKLLPIRLPRREQMLERRPQQSGPRRIAFGHQRRCIAALGKADAKAIVAQRPEEDGEPSGDEARDLVDLLEARIGATAAHATFPNSRRVTSGVKRARSS